MRDFTRIKTSFPVVEMPTYLLAGGYYDQGYLMLHTDEIFRICVPLKEAHGLLLRSDPVGRVGKYRGVFELSLGIEGYTPDVGSNPGPGVVGIEELMRVIVFNTYCDDRIVPAKVIENFVAELAKIHPWEHPIIQVQKNGQLQLFAGPED